jgi:hypothetical protein
MTNPQLVHQLVRDHEHKLMAAADQARLRRAALGRRPRRTLSWLRWRTHQPTTQIAR